MGVMKGHGEYGVWVPKPKHGSHMVFIVIVGDTDDVTLCALSNTFHNIRKIRSLKCGKKYALNGKYMTCQYGLRGR